MAEHNEDLITAAELDAIVVAEAVYMAVDHASVRDLAAVAQEAADRAYQLAHAAGERKAFADYRVAYWTVYRDAAVAVLAELEEADDE